VVRRRAIVHGRVQGVGFRYWLGRAAETRGVAGWARNLPDGTLEVVLEGAGDAVESVLRLAGEGPRGAQVDGVAVTEEHPEGLRGFAMG
jgi:acylphosphatase